ncbi:T9SS type A sorting domain-containing protein [Crocinitomix catalasitica]|nr:T9SS type A sorting domain-containing protein [Crocinitomix catalasitica]
MKKGLLLLLFLTFSFYSEAQENSWVKIKDWPGLKRTRVVGWSIGDFGYAGTGVDTAEFVFNDWWKFNPVDTSWTQVADVPGSIRRNAVGFVIGSFGYVGTGNDNAISDFGLELNDFYKYDPSINVWTPIASFPGGGIYAAAGFSIGTSGFVACGKWGPDWYSQQLWEYNSPSNFWTPRPNFPGGDRHQLSAFALEGKGYVGMGTDHDLYRKDWWQYDPSTFSWVEVQSLPGTERSSSSTFVLGSRAYVVFGTDGGFLKECWEYNPFSDSWNIKASFGGSARKYGVAFGIADIGYAGLGKGLSGKKQSWYKYTPAGPLSIEDLKNIDLQVFPNPVDETSLVSLPHEIQNGLLVIHNISGRLAYKEIFYNNNIRLDQANLRSGSYVLSIIDPNATLLGSTKIIVK